MAPVRAGNDDEKQNCRLPDGYRFAVYNCRFTKLAPELAYFNWCPNACLKVLRKPTTPHGQDRQLPV
jgi:hypothetical protein